MQATQQRKEWTVWHTVLLYAAMGPMVANTIETFVNRHYGWTTDYVPDTWAMPPLILGSCLLLVLRFGSDWRNGKLRLAYHGPLTLLTASLVAFGTWYVMATSSGGEVPLAGSMFFAGFAVACFLMLTMSSSDPN